MPATSNNTNVVDLTASYAVSSSNVFLTVIVGDAQIGQSIVLLNGNKVASGDIDKVTLGNGPVIKGQTLIIKSVVADVNLQSLNMSVSYQLSGGVTDQSFGSRGVVDNTGDTIIFRATFTLV
jgi:hypothetical protein